MPMRVCGFFISATTIVFFLNPNIWKYIYVNLFSSESLCGDLLYIRSLIIINHFFFLLLNIVFIGLFFNHFQFVWRHIFKDKPWYFSAYIIIHHRSLPPPIKNSRFFDLLFPCIVWSEIRCSFSVLIRITDKFSSDIFQPILKKKKKLEIKQF